MSSKSEKGNSTQLQGQERDNTTRNNSRSSVCVDYQGQKTSLYMGTQDVDMEIEAAPPGAPGDPSELYIQQRDPFQLPQRERELNSSSKERKQQKLVHPA